MSKITADSETLMKQAPWTAALYFRAAVENIDAMYHLGYAQEHPELVGLFMQTCAMDFTGAVIARAIETLSDQAEVIAIAIDDAAAQLAPERVDA